MKNRAAALAVGGLGLGVGLQRRRQQLWQPWKSRAIERNAVAVNFAAISKSKPATVPVVWHNVDNVTHRDALNDRSVNTENLAPGASSRRGVGNGRAVPTARITSRRSAA